MATSLGGCVSGVAKGPWAGEPAPRGATGAVEQLAGMSLAALREQYRRDLFDEFLLLMDKYVIDHRYGGFLCNVNGDGTHPDEIKETWFLGRGIWVYSFLYNHFEKRPEHLAVARGCRSRLEIETFRQR